VGNSRSEYLSANLDVRQSWLTVLRKFEPNSVDAANLASVAVDQFLVEHIADYVHVSLRRAVAAAPQ
jgi:hypothetical protein